VLDTHSPLVCLSIAPLYGLRHSPASCRLPPSDIQDKPPTVQVGHYGRPTVTAEVNHYRRLERKRKAFQESITRLEDQMFTTDMECRMCVSRLEAARAMVRIQGSMQDNQQAFRLSLWSVERGCLP
jgi:hypothetical protein